MIGNLYTERFAILYKVTHYGYLMILIFISHISDEEHLFICLKILIFYAPLKNSALPIIDLNPLNSNAPQIDTN